MATGIVPNGILVPESILGSRKSVPISCKCNTFAKIVAPWGKLSDVEANENLALLYKKLCVIASPNVIINDKVKVIVKGQVYWLRVKELDAWALDFSNDSNDSSSSDEDYDDNDVGRSDDVSENHVSNAQNNISGDPFGFYNLLNRSKDKEVAKSVDPIFPPGFTPDTIKETVLDNHSNHANVNVPGSNEGLSQSAKKRWIQELNRKHKVNFVAIQETKIEKINLFSINSLWGNVSYDYAFSPSVGYSGGILCVWDSNMFVKESVTISDLFVAIRGTWISTSSKLLIISVYAPQEVSERRILWDYIRITIESWEGKSIILRYFNEVRSEQERFGTSFNALGANGFNSFISMAGLVDLPLDGYKYTWSHESASKMSKLDRFLITEGLLLVFPFLSVIFEETWKNANTLELNNIILLKKKFQVLKGAIKNWCKEDNKRSNRSIAAIKLRLADVDKIIDQENGSDDIVNERSLVLKELLDFNAQLSLDMAQKAKIRWSIEGDENSKYFLGIINRKRSQLAICGVLVEGDWIDEPFIVKNEFLSHFAERFSSPPIQRITLDAQFPNQISFEQHQDLERIVTYDEIKCAVRDCGSNKSPGPDGFTFDFYRRYWKLIDHDVVNVVFEFFSSGMFPLGCNSSFITLIPKTQDAKVIKDFRPIILIGSVYKIIAKILANRLSLVIPYLISDVQSAFVANRQILDGPFIINELISWCKYKKTKAMLFKVDFEKAFDSVRWDYLDDILNKFGFGAKWRNWIQGYLNSAMGSILVNGSPTPEFKFHKGFYKGIQVDESLTLSHLFHVNDAVFIDKWDKSNIKVIVSVLNCFFLALGLKINLHKSKLMGINIPQDDVFMAANSIGCSTLTVPSNYLGVKVGVSSSRSCSWKDVLSKIIARLSKWKLKTLSIGDRLTLLKSVLTSLPLYQMSVYKVPMRVLNRMESMRRNFFNGVDNNDRKLTMIGWKKILTSKKKGGLGVSTIYGDHGALDSPGILAGRSPWIDIIREFHYMSFKGINLHAFVRKKVGDREQTLFWEDSWLSDPPLKNIFPRLYDLETDKHACVVSKFKDTSMSVSFRRVPRGGLEEEQFQLLVDKVAPVILSSIKDRWV
ncbi:RNA-directed DNA polymerase, eukaryota [Tanacetum coccineum]|uniref:RNA-directed DNA polymerase, eukaryota n=1 Tax=Tanacetum coccineum TaxID=301880 RepID=A0ABQ4ZK21_9ASTR